MSSFGRKVVALYSASTVNTILEAKNVYLRIHQGCSNVTVQRRLLYQNVFRIITELRIYQMPAIFIAVSIGTCVVRMTFEANFPIVSELYLMLLLSYSGFSN